ncbi:MATE family efflux transporter [Amorphus orientalis]|uniref:MATE family multidrug resistance protein n=1 Tax=Amorphus orientalis TaxID=649198 RepID=A0AAE3VRA8_9HYPH|nr:MATE family efflux transporter [Amorphus orientalis]MDQ0316760.1 MATE family multidrug resistance protein [Amorphus orientalis]
MDAPSTAAPIRPFAVTHRMVLAIAVPMTLAYVTTPLIGISDTAVIGQLGDAALLGAIAVGAILFDFLGTTFNFLRMGTTGLTAQAFGAEDWAEVQAVLVRALLVAAGAGLLVIALQGPILAGFLSLMGASEAVDRATRTYFQVRVVGAPLQFMNYALLGWLLGLGRAGTGLTIQFVLCAVNVALNVLLVLVWDFGVAGVAWASVAAEACALVLTLVLVARLLPKDRWPSRARIADRAQFLRMGVVNRDIMIRSLALMTAFTFFTAQGARAGDITLAANAVLLNFFLFCSFFLDGFATAAEQLAGRALGARFRPAFERAVKLSVTWGFAVAAVLSLAIFLGGGLVIDAITTAPGVREVARDYLVWAVVVPLAGVLAFEMDGVFIGATWTDDMRNMMLISLAAYFAIWAVAVPAFGNHGLWLALVTFLSMRGLTLLWRCRRRVPRAFPA